MSDDKELQHAALTLKQTVPLMARNRIATNPTNYALWYTYVEQNNAELTQALDKAIAQFGICPPSINDELYKTFIAKAAEVELNNVKGCIELILQDLSSSMHDALNDTHSFSSLIETSFTELEKLDSEKLSLEEIMTLVRRLISDSRSIQNSTAFLKNQLTTAGQEISRLKLQLAEAQKQTLFDALTSLYNRKAFDADILALQESNYEVCLIFMDIDHFKALNDQFGHTFGDAVLKSVAKRIQTSCREGITAYRYGGEEFAIILPNKPLRVARLFAEQLRIGIEKLRIKERRSAQLVSNITASFGVVEKKPGEHHIQLIERADTLLYEAKKLGRNRVMPIL